MSMSARLTTCAAVLGVAACASISEESTSHQGEPAAITESESESSTSGEDKPAAISESGTEVETEH
jgi:hypothetical protein